MADAPTYFSTISSDAVNAYIAAEMYTLAERQLVLGAYAKRYTLPQRMSKTMRVVRYKRMENPRTPLSEGVVPDAVALATENVDVAVEQWGLVALLTDVAEITTTHPALTIAIERVSRAMSEVIEREIAGVLMGGTNVFYGAVSGTPATTRIGLTGAYRLTTPVVLSAVAMLRANGAMDYDGGLYFGCLSPQLEADMMADTTFSAAATYSQVVRLNVAEIGTYGGVRWVRSNFLPIYKGVAVPGTQSASVSGIAASTGGTVLDGTILTVVSKDIQSGYERKVSAPYTCTDDLTVLTTPTSTNYVYDIYQTNTSGAAEVKAFANVLADTAKTITAGTYTAGTTASHPSVPYTTQEVFSAFIFGREAYGRVELSGMSLESFLTEKGASYSNPLAQGRKAGAKVMWKSFIIDNNYFCRLESNSAISAYLPA
jgi:N4-gp56 family major capsid protein